MRDEEKTQDQLIEELSALRVKCSELESIHTQDIESLRDSEKKFRRLFDDLKDPISIYSPNERMVNQAWLDLFGYSSEEMEYLDTSKLYVNQEDRKRYLQDLEKSGFVKDFEVKLRRKDGSEIDCLYTSTSRQKEDGAIELRGIVRDITGVKRIEESLRESEERYRTVIEDLSEIISRFTPDGTFVFVNDVFCRFFGKKREELIGNTWLPVAHPEDVVTINISLAAMSPDNPVIIVENRVFSGKGTMHWMEFVNRGLYDIHGKLKEIQSVGRDITDRKRAEEALQKERDNLEQLVMERTQELNLANELLRKKITQHIRTESALRENEQRLATIYNTVGDVIFHLAVEPDGQFRFVSVNQAFRKVTGLSPETVVGKMVNEIIPEPSLTMVIGKYRQAIEEKTVVFWEETSDYPNGRLTGEVSIAPVFDHNDICTHLVGSVHDITGRKRAEEELRKSRGMLRFILDTNPQSIFWKDQNSVYLGCNMVFAQLAGFDNPDDIIGKNDFDLPWHKEEAEKYRADDKAVLFSKASRPHILEQWCQADGTPRWAETNKMPLLDEFGNTYGIMGVFEDITQRKLLEEALQESVDRFRDVTFSMADWVWETDEDGVYTYSSNKGFDILRRRVQEIIGKTPYDFMPPDEVIRVKVILSEIMKNKAAIINLENWNIGRNGERICLLTNGVPILDHEGRLKGYRGVGKDITKLKQVEDALRESEKRYRHIFETVPISIREYDCSEMLLIFEKLRNENVTDLNAYFTMNPEILVDIASSLHLVDCNDETIRMYDAKSKDEIFHEYGKHHIPENLVKYRDVAIAWMKGERVITLEMKNETVIGRQIDILMRMMIPQRGGERILVSALDITELKRAQESLRVSEERFKLSMDATNDGLWDWNIKTDQTYYNPGYYRMLGYEPGPLSNKSEFWSSLIHPDDREHTLQVNKDCIEGLLEQFEVEYRMKALNGEWRWILGRGMCIKRDETGRAFRMAGTHVDITERKRAEEKFRLSEERYREIFEIIPISVWEYDYSECLPMMNEINSLGISDYNTFFKENPDILRRLISSTRLLNVNQETVRMYGAAGKQDIFRQYHKHLTDEATQAHREIIIAFMEGGKRIVIETANETLDLRHIDIVLRTAFTDEMRKSGRLLATVEDVTERNRTEGALRESEAALKKAQMAAHLGNWKWDISANRVQWSDEMFRIFGLDDETFTGDICEVIATSIHPDDRAKVEDSIHPVAVNKMPIPLEYRIIRPDQSVRTVFTESLEFMLDKKGNLAFLTGIVQDITEKKQIEETLRFRLAEKEVLISEIHHRVKNNLQIISSLLDLSHFREESVQASNIIRDARSRIQTMGLIHNQLMNSDSFGSINIQTYVIDMLEFLFQLFDFNSERISSEVDITDIFLKMDQAVPFSLVTHEIITNSLKHAFPDKRPGKIRIEIRESFDGVVTACFSDDGIGMADLSKSKRMESNGLNIVDLIVREQLHGSICISRERGTMVCISFRNGDSSHVSNHGCG